MPGTEQLGSDLMPRIHFSGVPVLKVDRDIDCAVGVFMVFLRQFAG
jgi:hypothetical protein